MNTATWIVAAVLAGLYLTAGLIKTTQPMQRLAGFMPWTTSLSRSQVRLLGIAELLGALGLVLPKLLGVVDERAGADGTLTALAATGLALVQLGAVPLHLRRGEPQVLPLNGGPVRLAVADSPGRQLSRAERRRYSSTIASTDWSASMTKPRSSELSGSRSASWESSNDGGMKWSDLAAERCRSTSGETSSSRKVVWGARSRSWSR